MSIMPSAQSARLRNDALAPLVRLPPVVPPRALRAAGRLARPAAIGSLLPLGLLATWSLVAHYELVAPQILPAPSRVWASAIELVGSGQLQSELAVSLTRVAAGLALGSVAGLAVGLAMGLSRTIEAYLGPTVRAIWLVPSLGWLPFFMLIFGIGEALKVVLIAKACFLPMMVASCEGVRNIPRKHFEVARVLELGSFDAARFVILPAIVPSVLNGFRLALSKGWQVLVLVEMIASAAGIGYLMTWGRKAFQLDIVLVTIVVIGITGWVLDRAALAIQHHLAAWSRRSADA